jgi:thioredoxin reductase
MQFEDGESTRMGFLQHSPPTEIVGAGLAKDLGVEIVSDGFGGKVLKTNPPFGETNVNGAFAAGDLISAMKNVPTAMQQGVSAGAGVAMQLGHEAGEEVAAKLWPEDGRSDGGRWDH